VETNGLNLKLKTFKFESNPTQKQILTMFISCINNCTDSY